ncbi:hypothetical protein M1307_03205 [Patescibacteria group bacterium]|nr:hypothetical protein [Patescibacteria group bacterium]
MAIKNELGQSIDVEPEMNLSAETPVLDKLDHGREIKTKTIETLINNTYGVTDIFVLGESHSGKETIAGQLLFRVLEDGDLQKSLEDQGLELKIEYFSTAMAVDETGKRNKIGNAQRGENTFEEFKIVSETTDEILEESRAAAKKPTLRIIEAIGTGYPLFDLGDIPLKNAIERAKKAENYKVIVIFVIGTKEIQDLASGIRKDIEVANLSKELKKAFEKGKMKPDEEIETSEDVKFDDLKGSYVRSWGNEVAREVCNKASNKHAVDIQDELREKDISLPVFSEQDLINDDNLRMRVLKLRCQYLAGLFGVPEEDLFIEVNRAVKGDIMIPFYRALLKGYRMKF